MARYGIWGGRRELFDLWQDTNENPGLLEKLGFAGSGEGDLQEGTGAPEGRADFPIFLQTIIRFKARERFRATASKWQRYAGTESATDFREHRVTQMNGIHGIQPIPENGEYPRMRSTEEEGPPFAVAKHGGMYSVTFELVVNDETDYILKRAPAEIGRTSAEYKSRVLVNFIESNPTYAPDGQPFFSPAHGNEVVGVGAQPTEDNLATIIETMTLRRDSTGTPYNVEPNTILVKGFRQKLRFRQILRSAESVQTTESASNTQFLRGSDNPLSYDGGIISPNNVIDEPWLNDPDDWYVLGNAANRPAFIMSFLRGRQEPMIAVKESVANLAMGAGKDPYDWEWDSVDFKVRDIFGTSVGEPVGAFRARPS